MRKTIIQPQMVGFNGAMWQMKTFLFQNLHAVDIRDDLDLTVLDAAEFTVLVYAASNIK